MSKKIDQMNMTLRETKQEKCKEEKEAREFLVMERPNERAEENGVSSKEVKDWGRLDRKPQWILLWAGSWGRHPAVPCSGGSVEAPSAAGNGRTLATQEHLKCSQTLSLPDRGQYVGR